MLMLSLWLSPGAGTLESYIRLAGLMIGLVCALLPNWIFKGKPALTSVSSLSHRGVEVSRQSLTCYKVG